MPIVNVTLEDVLRAHDTRAAAQRRLLRTYRLPLVSFTMNIAGPVKSSPLIALAFDAGLEALYGALGRPVTAEIIRPATGCEALLVYDRPAAELKAACLALETATPVAPCSAPALSAVGRWWSAPAAAPTAWRLSWAARMRY